MWCATFAPTLRWEVPVLVVAGGSGVAFAAVASTRLQLNTTPAMRGRVMAFYAIAVFGTRVVGGPIVGWFGEHVGTRASLGIGAVAVTVALPVWLLLRPGAEAAGIGDRTAWESPAPESG
jgi:MFS family permease